eukprot:EG_transcript_11006
MAGGYTCRICFEEEPEERLLVSPCDCRGSQKFVHAKCLRRWQHSIQVAGNPRHAHFCQVCQRKFTVLPEPVSHGHGSCHLLAWYVSLLMGVLLVLVAQRSLLALVVGGVALLVYCLLVFFWLGVKPMLIQDDEGRVRMYLTRIGRPVPGLYAGQVLVHQGPHVGLFGGSVVLIVSHTMDGTTGFILNKPVSQTEYQRYGGPPAFCASAESIHRGVGGPVSPDEWTVLHVVPNVASASEACPGIYVGGAVEDLLLAPAGHVKVVRGMACWAPQQLDGEIRAGCWSFLEVSAEELFRPDVSTLWEDLSQRDSLPVL